MFFGSILLKIRISTRAILLRGGGSGRLDPRAGEPISIRDGNRGRGEDDYPVELCGDHSTVVGKCRGDYGHAQPGGAAPPTSLPPLTYMGKASTPDGFYT